MPFLFRTASVLNVGASVALKTLKFHRPTLNYAYFATTAYGVGQTVKLDSYEHRRKNALQKLKESTKGLRLKIITNLDSMAEINARDIQELIFTADESDLELVMAALKKLELQSAHMRFSSFYLDAVTMRMFSYLDLPEKAYEAFLDEDLKNLFTGYNAVVILLDLLYKKGLYQHIVDCVDVVEKRQNFNVWSSRGTGCFYMTACLKVNTPESLSKAMRYYEKLLKYREPVPELTLLAILISLRTDPERMDGLIKLLQPRAFDPKTIATYADLKTNFMLQYLISLKKLSDVEVYVSNAKCCLAKDIYESIGTLSKELSGVDNSNEMVKDCKVLDMTLEEWIIHQNSSVQDQDDRNLKASKHNKKRQEFLQ